MHVLHLRRDEHLSMCDDVGNRGGGRSMHISLSRMSRINLIEYYTTSIRIDIDEFGSGSGSQGTKNRKNRPIFR